MSADTKCDYCGYRDGAHGERCIVAAETRQPPAAAAICKTCVQLISMSEPHVCPGFGAPETPPRPDRLDLEPIKAREAKATKGPWRSMMKGNCEMEDGLLRAISEVEGLPRPWNPVWVGWHVAKNYFKTFMCDDDAKFVAHARQDMPALIAEVERLRAVGPRPEVENLLREVLKRIEEWEDAEERYNAPREISDGRSWADNRESIGAKLVKGQIETAQDQLRALRDEISAALLALGVPPAQHLKSCSCPAQHGEDCPLTIDECQARTRDYVGMPWFGKRLQHIFDGFVRESVNGVVCSIPDTGLNTPPHRTWCARCQRRYMELKSLGDMLVGVPPAAPPPQFQESLPRTQSEIIERFKWAASRMSRPQIDVALMDVATMPLAHSTATSPQENCVHVDGAWYLHRWKAERCQCGALPQFNDQTMSNVPVVAPPAAKETPRCACGVCDDCAKRDGVITDVAAQGWTPPRYLMEIAGTVKDGMWVSRKKHDHGEWVKWSDIAHLFLTAESEKK